MQADYEQMSSRRGKARWTERPNQLKSLRRPLFPLLPRSTCWATSWLPAEQPVPPSCQWLAGDWSGIWPKHILPPFNLSLFPACQFWPIFPFPTHCTGGLRLTFAEAPLASSAISPSVSSCCHLPQLEACWAELLPISSLELILLRGAAVALRTIEAPLTSSGQTIERTKQAEEWW